MIDILPAALADAGPMADALRSADVRELSASGCDDPEGAIRSSLSKCDHTWSGWAYGYPVAIGGIGRIGSLVAGVGMPWMLGTELMDQMPREALRKTRSIFLIMQAEYPNQFNWVHAENEKAIVWLRWLGYTLRPAAPHGSRNEMFHLFTLGTPYV